MNSNKGGSALIFERVNTPRLLNPRAKMITLMTSSLCVLIEGSSTLARVTFGARSCFVGGDSPGHYRMLSSILSGLDANGTPSPMPANQICPDLAIHPSANRINPRWEPRVNWKSGDGDILLGILIFIEFSGLNDNIIVGNMYWELTMNQLALC